MRNILDYVPQKEKQFFAAVLKEIWLAPTAELARKRAYDVVDAYAKRFPKAVQCLENGLEDSLMFYAFPKLDVRKISSSNMIEGPEGLAVERRDRPNTGQPRKLSKEVEEDLIAENQRMRAEVVYLKILQALVLEDDRRQHDKRW